MVSTTARQRSGSPSATVLWSAIPARREQEVDASEAVERDLGDALLGGRVADVELLEDRLAAGLAHALDELVSAVERAVGQDQARAETTELDRTGRADPPNPTSDDADRRCLHHERLACLDRTTLCSPDPRHDVKPIA